MIYVHVPFCRSFCTYCGFYSEVAPKCRSNERSQEGQIEAYLSALESEIRARRHEIDRVFASGGVNTLYIGGGTPSILPVSAFERLVAALGRPEYREFTVEVNPEDIVEKGVDYVRALKDFGVNRISMGVQSFDEGILRFMNRRHSADQARQAYRIIEDAGIENISIDLIFGLPQLSDGLWRETITQALNISSKGVAPRHISAYQLSVEPGSMLEKLMTKGRFEEAPEQLCARQYEILCEELSRAGYHHYEISNFAQPGCEARHNSAYWRHVPYVGLGPGAHSFMLRPSDEAISALSEDSLLFVRQWNKEDIRGYVEAAQYGDFTAVMDGEVLDGGQIVMEKVMLGLRTSAGLPEDVLRGCCAAGAVDRALASGDLVYNREGNLRIPQSRFFVSDRIVSNLI